MRLENRVAVITGCGAGCGKAAAILFAGEGATVIGVDKDAAKGQETTGELKKTGRNAFFIEADVAGSGPVRRMAEECAALTDRVDVLFNNAGYSVKSRFEDTTEEQWAEMLDVLLTGTFLCSKYLLPLMKKSEHGAIVHHASLDAILGNPLLAAYSVAKGGLIPLTHVMARDLAKYKIRVNAICSAGIKTSFTGPGHEARMAVTPVGRAGTAEEIAYTALFLACDESSYINGTHIVVDGGRSAITQGCYNI